MHNNPNASQLKMTNNNETFYYTYSADEQKELQAIREKYIPREESPMDQLRRLDASVTRPGTAIALVVGILGALILGTGMSCCMVWGGEQFVPGILIGILGMAGVFLAYPMFRRITRKQREKIAPEILRLTDELMR